MDVRLTALKQANASLAYLVSVDMDALVSQLDARLSQRVILMLDILYQKT